MTVPTGSGGTESLALRLARESRLSEAEVRRIGLALAEALAAAHEQAGTHGDVRTANVFEEADGTISLADIGPADPKAAGDLSYRAPEVLKGEAPGPAADWYGLGATLYELSSGHPPFYSGDVRNQILNSVPTRLEGVSPELATVVAGMLAKTPGFRPNSTTICETLAGTRQPDPVPEGSPVIDETPVAVEAGTVDERPRPTMAIWIGLGAAVVIAGVGAWVFLSARRPDSRAAGAPVVTASPAATPTPTETPVTPTPTPPLQSEAAKPSPSPAATPAAAGIPNIQWARIPAGTFQMGCAPGDTRCDADEKPAHAVRLTRSYDLMVTEVTAAMFRSYVAAKKISAPVQPKWSTDRHPVVNVDWTRAAGFCGWIGGRLPTEAEWERAARGGAAGGVFPWGGLLPNRDAVGQANGAWFNAPFAKQFPVAVGTYQPNPFGLYDVAGNVREWVSDWYGPFTRIKEGQTDPGGPSAGKVRVLRGGSWNSGDVTLRVSDRSAATRGTGKSPEERGIRCARDVPR